ncbi:unnamed protein product [Hymenolepis diminuta]|uniref:DUF5746 domain-containing protein n=1 Tax=Hymenolepis diminuta TaxID=6216 RepID=A0A0R3SRT3_HYMDI|nr:unnamed protein product [Hymenolepis diminuta]
MCQEYVNRTAFAETETPSSDICNNGSYNGFPFAEYFSRVGMYDYRPGIAVSASPNRYDGHDHLLRHRAKINVASDDSRERLFPIPYGNGSRLISSLKLGIIILSLLAALIFIGIVVWIIWTRSSYSYPWSDEGPLGPENPPAICYKCSNYFHMMDGREVNSNIDVEKGESGGIEISGYLGVAIDVEDPRQELCQEVVNRTALAEIQVPLDDDCGDSLYDGCFKMVTKSFRMVPNIGREALSVTVVTRNCAELPKNLPLGCYKTFGGAGMEREICYCKGNYCNSAISMQGSIAVTITVSTYSLVSLLYKLFKSMC